MGRSIKITGIKELEAKLKKNATLDDARTVVKKNGAELQTLMTRNAVFVKGYSTGATKRSIRCTFTDLNLTATVEQQHTIHLILNMEHVSCRPSPL